MSRLRSLERQVDEAEKAATTARENVETASGLVKKVAQLLLDFIKSPGSYPHLDMGYLSSELQKREEALEKRERALEQRMAFLKEIESALRLLGDYLAPSASNSFKVNLISKEAVLWTGTIGCVFQVRRNDGNFVALKLVSSNDLSLLEDCAKMFVACQETGDVAKLLSPFTVLDGGLGAAILLSPVGEPWSRDDLNKDGVTKLFECLFQLHHAGFVHGDACLGNLIKHQDEYLSIDFTDCTNCKPSYQTHEDCATCGAWTFGR
ncbi:hypothetical protein HDU96_009726 [Phlyctochytrium bullatum]|nr:hypothetical protein HDU96_009726 [Phlyctochytrium bullatum]